MVELWKSINGYEGIYEISNLGRVKALARTQAIYTWFHGHYVRNFSEKLMTLKIDIHGYMRVALRKLGQPRKNFQIHRLVLFAFVGNPKNHRMQCNHIDGVKDNNHVDNLEWTRPSTNQKHAYMNGNNALNIHRDPLTGRMRETLTWEQGMEIRKLVNGGLGKHAAARKFGTSKTTVNRIVRFEGRWK